MARTIQVQHRQVADSARHATLNKTAGTSPVQEDSATQQDLMVQPSLWIGTPDSAHERQADRVADRLIHQQRTSASPQSITAGNGAQPLMSEAAREEEETSLEEDIARLQTSAVVPPPQEDKLDSACGYGLSAHGGSAAMPVSDHELSSHLQAALNQVGKPLPGSLRAWMEPELKADLGSVRLHTDSQSAALAERLGVAAFALQNHLFFGDRAYRPDTTEGLHVLAHETAHTQQRNNHAATLHCYDPQVTQREEEGAIVILHNGTEWVRVEWEGPASQVPRIEVNELGTDDWGGPRVYGVKVRSPNARANVIVNTAAHDNRDPHFHNLFSYDIYTGGDVRVDGVSQGHRWRCRYPYNSPYALELRFRSYWIDDWNEIDPWGALEFGQECGGADDLERRLQGLPTFSDWREMEDYIREHASENFLGVMKPNGEFVAVQVSERDMQTIAGALRSEEAWEIEDVQIEAERPEFYVVTGIYVRGRPMSVHQTERLLDQFYHSAEAAEIGYGQSAFQEAEVYRMGTTSFGRKPYTHAEALERWRELDRRYNYRTIQNATTPGGGRFVSLHVETPRGPVTIDEQYFRGRDVLIANAQAIEDYNGGLPFFLADHPDLADDIRHYLRIELHRELDADHSTRLQSIIASRDSLANDLGAQLYNDMARQAQSRVSHVLTQTLNELNPLNDNPDRFREFLQSLPFARAEERRTRLTAIGVPGPQLTAVARVMSDPARAARVLSGETEHERFVYGGLPYYEHLYEGFGQPSDDFAEPSAQPFPAGTGGMAAPIGTLDLNLAQFRTWLSDHVEGLNEFKEKIEDGTIPALNLEGELGNHVRADLYRRFGFTELNPEDFPHDNITFEFMPDAADPTQLQLQTLGEQMFANYCARQEDIETLILVGKITAMVVATVVFALIANVAAGAVVGWLGWTGFAAAATEVVVSAVVFTALQQALTIAMTGELPELEDVLLDLGMNLAVFSVFRLMQPFMQSTAQALARTRAFQLTGSLAEAGAARAGFSITGGAAAQFGAGVFTEFVAFLGFSLAIRTLHGQLPTRPREWFLILWESMSMAFLMRVGGMMMRPHMENLALWARARRLGDMAGRIDQFQGDRIRFQRDMFALRDARPHRLESELPRLMQEGERLLTEQRSILERIRSRYRRQVDQAELRAAEEELLAIRELLKVARDLGGLRDLNLQPVGERGEFTYTQSDQALEMARRFWGEENVSYDAESGRIRIRVEGGEDMHLFPEQLQAQAEAFAEQRGSLLDRMRALEERVTLFGVEGEAIDRVLGTRPEGGGRVQGRLRPGARGPEGLREAEQLIEAAEQMAGEAITRQAGRIYRQWMSIPERAAITREARQGELAGMTDAEIGEAVLLFAYRQRLSARGQIETVRTIQGLTATALRGIFFAYRNGLNLPRLRGALRNVTVAERNDLLETYAQMVEARVQGIQEAMTELMQSRHKLEGGMWVFAFVRSNIGIETVRGLERPSGGTRSDADRVWDVVTHDGRRIELKAWRRWQHGSLESQFQRDVRHVLDGDLAAGDARNLALLQYVFKPPAPLEIPQIRSRLRSALENMLVEEGVGMLRRAELLSMFDQHSGLVVEGIVGREGPALRSRPEIAPPLPGTPAVPSRPEEEEHQPEAIGQQRGEEPEQEPSGELR